MLVLFTRVQVEKNPACENKGLFNKLNIQYKINDNKSLKIKIYCLRKMYEKKTAKHKERSLIILINIIRSTP